MKKTRDSAGFTLLELLVGIAVFTIVGAVALSLVAKNLPLYNRQEGMTALNISLRGAGAQMEQDLVNAGSGYYTGSSVPAWPIGVTIANSAGGSCYDSATQVYGASCFDTLNIIMMDQNTPPAHLDTSYSTTGSSLTIIPPAGWTADAYKDKFANNDQVFLLTDNGNLLTTVRLTAAGALDGTSTKVVLSHASTNADGTNSCASPCNDPWNITTHANDKLSASFDSNDWLFRLTPVQYFVDTTTATNPKLMRRVGTGTAEVIAEQIIGFKVGASIWNDTNGTDYYVFDSSAYPDDPSLPSGNGAYNFSRVRSVRVSLIGRTPPSNDPTYTFRNTFDGQAYQIQATSLVVNPRNLSMKEQQP